MANLTVSSSVDSMMQASDASGIRDAIGSVNYPYTTDFISGVEQTRNLTTIDASSGYQYQGGLTSVYVGSNVTSIGDGSFENSGLTIITISDSVASIGDDVFIDCVSLTGITIPNSVTSIGSSAFAYCNALLTATIGSGVTLIKASAFSNCTSLATINCFATTAPSFESNIFSGIAASDIHVPVGATGYGTTYAGLTVVYDL